MESCVLIKKTQWILVLARATIGFELWIIEKLDCMEEDMLETLWKEE